MMLSGNMHEKVLFFCNIEPVIAKPKSYNALRQIIGQGHSPVLPKIDL